MKKINYIDSIRHPVITEKATILSEQNKTVFKVHEKANKKTIKKNIEKLFKVNVIKVNIINQKSKFKIKQGKKSRLQDELVKYCIERDGEGKDIYIFTNDDVKRLSMPIGFRNHNDATHIDSSAGLSPLMQKENLAFVHLHHL